jgi:hypothetical protein
MNLFRRSFYGVLPIVLVCWVVTGLRLVFEGLTTDLNVVAMFSLYMTIAVIFLFAGITGVLDHLAWKPLLLGSVVIGLACFFVPNSIAYSVAQFKGWQHGRFYVDQEHWAVQKKLMEDDGMGMFEASDKAAELIGRKPETRGPPPADTTLGKLQAGLLVGSITCVIGALWSLLLGTLFVGIPATVRRRSRGSGDVTLR